ncbi:hypothetical protein [Algisphaera agarilytica]|uniref:Uncharacterized protein n=1 Tax=Algisphaera agarilytica TaxID=1385975 RepID=A0A7X0HBI2_9BACT|nr:hypothetical protein [Algisphaera agarilytica]MBB6431379.1 hypothetical protein [Algisphaera agarilytica]
MLPTRVTRSLRWRYTVTQQSDGRWIGAVYAPHVGNQFLGPFDDVVELLTRAGGIVRDDVLIRQLENGGVK